MSDKEKKDHSEYDEEPVYYCKRCLSLRIRTMRCGDYCDVCGSVSIGTASIFEHERLKQERIKKLKEK